MKITLTLFIILVILVVGFLLFGQENVEIEAPVVESMQEDTNTEQAIAMMMQKTSLSADEMMKKVDGEMMTKMMQMVYQYEGVLSDVTAGEDIRGVNTKGESSGLAKANYKDGQYNLLATFENLPDPVGSDFYEGWIVRKGLNFDVISSGALEKIDGVYTNTYVSGQDLTDHSFYVLTLEPDDGNPAPADHILEGVMQ